MLSRKTTSAQGFKLKLIKEFLAGKLMILEDLGLAVVRGERLGSLVNGITSAEKRETLSRKIGQETSESM